MKPSPYETPALQKFKREMLMAKGMASLVQMHQDFKKNIALVQMLVAGHSQEAKRIRTLPKGEKGDRGEKGVSGTPGNAGRDGINGRDGLTPVRGKDYHTKADEESFLVNLLSRIHNPKDGKDAVMNEDKLMQKILDRILSEKLLTKDHINGLEPELRSISSIAGRQYGKNTWARGGGDTLAAGINTTLTRNPDGTTSVNATGGSGTQVDNEVVSGSGTAWTLAHTPTTNTLRLYANGQRLTPTVDYSLVGAAITTILSWSAGTVIADYSYV